MNKDDSLNHVAIDLATDLGAQLSELNRNVATVESCTGGGVAQAITSVAGSSQWFDRGYVTYSNHAKSQMIGVPPDLIENCGAVSVEVAAAMAECGLHCSEANYCVAVTGVAGPGGGSAAKPVGTVCFAWAGGGRETRSERVRFDGDRHQVREQSIARAIGGLLELLRTAT